VEEIQENSTEAIDKPTTEEGPFNLPPQFSSVFSLGKDDIPIPGPGTQSKLGISVILEEES
jgi:hypothetical protein